MHDPAAVAAAVSEAIDEPLSVLAPGFEVAQAVADGYWSGSITVAYRANYRRIIEGDQPNGR